MIAFFHQQKSFLASLAFLILSLAIVMFTTQIAPMRRAATDMAEIQRIVGRENAQMRDTVNDLKKKKAEGTDEAIENLPNFLRRINAIANLTNVIVKQLTPVTEGGIKFNIKITTDFYTFLRFISQLESLNVAINDMQVRPYDNTKKPPIHAIEFSITPRRDAEEIAGARIEDMKKAVGITDKRNPFQRFAYDPSKMVTQEIDLTWIYKLSGIGQVGEEKVATIDNRDYRRKDQIENMTITQIRSDRVELERKTDHGIDRYVLKFRSQGIKKP